MKKFIVVVAVLATVCGCASEQAPAPEPVLSQLNDFDAERVNNPGSLFDPGQSEFLFDDNRASRVGDIVMVEVSEKTIGKHKADTSSKKTGDNDYSVTALPKNGIYGLLGKLGGAENGTEITTSSKSDLSTTGETKAESNLTTTVAARVIRILPGRVLQVEGARQLRINAETQILVVRGLVRQRDINSKNTIPSSYLADARIEVYGQGELADRQKSGWMTRFVNNIWPW
jgi:flagellar L-ring protein FlgH